MNIPRKVPHIIVDNKHNNLLGLFSTLSGELHREQALHLEGDFDDHFTLYAPKEYERDALYLFTPNVMQAILDTMPNADLELVDDSLIVYETKQKSVTRKDTIESLLAVATILAPKLGHQVDYYTDERVDSRSKNTVSSKGRRLNASRDAGLVFTLVAFSMLIISRFADDPRKGLFMASFMLGIPLLIFVVAVIISKRKD